MITNIPLERIDPNPWQPRQGMDPAGIHELALSIARGDGPINGLMQVPVARRVGERYQLALGHRRVEAFRVLESLEGEPSCPDSLPEGDPLAGAIFTALAAGRTFGEIPLDIQELTDRQMFEMAVSENIQREDLNPVEQAAAEQRYMSEFGASSEEAGAFFGKSASTIRGDVRLLDLPEGAKRSLADGQITVGAARKLLTVQRVAGYQAATQVAEEMALPGEDAESLINQQLRKSTEGIEMWAGWREQIKPLAGTGLWPISLTALDFPNDHLPELTKAEAYKALGLTAETATPGFDTMLKVVIYDPSKLEDWQKNGWPDWQLERIAHLIEPPGCSTCLFYARMDKLHYCALAVCHRRKVKAWSQMELERLSKELGIPVYDTETDGKQTYGLKKTWNDNGKAQKLYEARTDVRLRAKYTSTQTMYGNKHDFTSSYLVEAVVVGKTAQKLIEKKKKENAPDGAAEKKWAEERRRNHIEWENRQHSEKFEEEIASPIFAPAFAGIEGVAPILALLRLDQTDMDDGFEAASKGKKLEMLRVRMADEALENAVDYRVESRGPIATAKYLMGLATTWGVQLPEAWLDLAQPYCEGLEEYEDADGKIVVVSIETEKKE